MTITDGVSAASLPVAAGVATVLALTFTPENINTIIISVVALVTALGIAAVNIMNARSAQKERNEQKAVAAETLTKTNVIEGHVNSAASKADAIIKSQEIQLAMQRETIIKMEQTAALLAQTAAVAAAHASTTPAAALAGDAPAASLKQIDKNTADTAVNTKRTDAVVQDLKDHQ